MALREGMSCGLDVEPQVAFREGQKQKQKVNMRKASFKSLATGLCAVGLFIGMLNVAQATIAFTPTGLSAVDNPEGVGNDGLFFTPNVNILVTALGYIAPQVGGNQVGIFNVTANTLLVSTTVTTSDPMAGGFYYDSIAPLALTAGVQYAVVGLWLSPPNGSNANGGVGAASEITFNGYKYNGNNYLSLPDTGYVPAIFGPNFQFSAVPEPTTMVAGALLLLPFGASTLRILRKRTA